MPSVNLLPPEEMMLRLKRRRVRRWVVAGALSWGVAAIPAGRELVAQYQLSAQRAAMDEVSSAVEQTRRRRDESASRLKVLLQDINRAEKLRFKRSWSSLLAAVGAAMPERVWLTSVATDPAKLSVSLNPTTPARSSVVPTAVQTKQPADVSYGNLPGRSGPRHLILDGQAVGLEDVYSFVDALNRMNMFGQATLATVSAETIEDVRVTRFRVECEW